MSESNNSYYQLPGSIIQQHHNPTMPPILSESSSLSSSNENSVEYPVLLLTQQPDSHHFNERRIVLNDTIKVGRSVARARPTDLNAIFDCKVLSRNHAIFWFDNGKVWLRDTKSSNGTFVNSQLLSKGTEDSPPREIYSGDIIQFGVEVVENTTTHGCIIAQVSIFMSDGSEIRRQPDMGGLSSGSIPISNYYEEQIYQLAQYIQEAAHREQTLEKKLNSLGQLIIDTQEASDSSWKVILNQDRLMEKLEMLQEQVEIHLKGDEQDSLASELRRVLEQRYGLERESKNLLERLIQEKADALQRVVDLEHSLETSEEECSQLRSAFELLQLEHGKITSKVVAGKDEVDALQKRLQEAQTEYSTEMSLLSADKEALLNRYSQLCEEAEHLRAKLEGVELELAEGHTNFLTESPESGKIQDMLQESSDRQMDLTSSVKGLQTQLSKALISEIIDLQNLQRLEISMANSETDLNSFLMGTTSDLALYFIQTYRQIRDGLELITLLKDEVNRLQKSLPTDCSAESTLHEMEGLLGKMSDCQNKTQSILNEIPNRLVQKVKDQNNLAFLDQSCQTFSTIEEPVSCCDQSNDSSELIDKQFAVTQTNSVNLVNSASQHSSGTRHQCIHVQTIDPYPSLDPEVIVGLQVELQQYQNRLEAEKKISDSLKMDLVQLRTLRIFEQVSVEDLNLQICKLESEKQELQDKSCAMTEELSEIQKKYESIKNDLEQRKETMQRISASEYGQLYQESQKLRKQVQEIEEEMNIKRKEYDLLFEQYEALLSGDNNLSQLQPNPVTDKIQELEKLCSKQRTEIEDMRESMNEQYQTILARSRRISAISSVPLCVLILAIIIFILSFLAKPWTLTDSRQ